MALDFIKLKDSLKTSVEEDMTHIFVIPNVEMGGSKWFDPVTDEEFKN